MNQQSELRQQFELNCLNKWHLGIGKSETFDRYDDDKTAFAWTVYQCAHKEVSDIFSDTMNTLYRISDGVPLTLETAKNMALHCVNKNQWLEKIYKEHF